MQVIGKENANHRQIFCSECKLLTKKIASHWQGKCKTSITLLYKMQTIGKKIQVIDDFSIENASYRQIYYIKCKLLAKKNVSHR